jgi:hypothetical protein
MLLMNSGETANYFFLHNLYVLFRHCSDLCVLLSFLERFPFCDWYTNEKIPTR